MTNDLIPLAMIVAVAENGVIGRDNQLPWHIPEDLKWFKEKTMNKPMIMGRKTFESLGRPLRGRAHIVLTQNSAFHYKGVREESVYIVQTLDQAFKLGRELASEACADEVMVIGGAAIYQQALPLISKIYRTLVYLKPEGDAFFDINEADWEIVMQSKKTSQAVNFFLLQVLEKRS